MGDKVTRHQVIRPDWNDWALGIAKAIARRGDCTRRKVGAVILDPEHRIVGSGYNGGPRGGLSCLAGQCPRGCHYEVPDLIHDPYCVCGNNWPCRDAVEPGSSYDTGPGRCIAVHAEMNALLDVENRDRLRGSTLYVTEAPCDGCVKIIANTPVKAVVWPYSRMELK